MASPARPEGQYSFGVFAADIRSGELRKHGMRVKLQERPFQLLIALLEQPGETITREELRQRLWPEGTFVNFDQSISSSVNKLRSALNDSSTHPRFVETVGSRGYRFLADVKLVSAARALAEEKPTFSALPAAPEQTGRPAARRWMFLLAAIAITGLGITTYFLWKHSSRLSAAAPGRVMLAVLPFDNLTGDASQDYFSDGLTEEMITQLGRLDPQRLAVIARASVMTYKNRQQPIEKIGHELGVQYVLEGSVRRDATQVRITAQLIQVRDQTPLWTHQYDRELKDLLLLQDEIAGEISDEMQITLGDNKPTTPATQSSLTPQAYEAYNLYLQGEFFLNKRTVKGLNDAIHYFEQATAKDPNSARAFAGLADSYALMSGYSGIPQNHFAQKARAAALRALEIDETLPEAHTALALIVENYDWDWQTAEKEYRRAIELNPNYATAHHWYAEYLTWRGRFDEALQESERARQLDPLSLIIATDNAAILYDSRQYDRAIKQFRYVLQMEPNFPRAGVIAEAYVQKGMFTEAIAFVEKEPDNGNPPWHLAYLAYVYGRSGRQAQAQRAIDKMLVLNRQEEFDPIALSWAYIGVGDKEKALACLEKAYSQRANGLTALKVDPLYDPLRGESRFQLLQQRVGLAP